MIKKTSKKIKKTSVIVCILLFFVNVSCFPVRGRFIKKAKLPPEMEKLYTEIWSCPLEFEVGNDRADEYWQKICAYVSKLRDSTIRFLTDNYMEAKFRPISYLERIRISRARNGEGNTKFIINISWDFATYHLEFEARKLAYWLIKLGGDFNKMDWIQKDVKYRSVGREIDFEF